MGQLILCKSPRTEKPFFIQSAKVNIYSLEELMYYAQSARYVAREDFMNDRFVDWVNNDLGMKRLGELLQQRLDIGSGLKDFFLPIEAANDFLTGSELQILNMQLQKFDHMSALEAKKLYADQIMLQGRYLQAIYAYRALLNDEEVIRQQGHVAGDIWGNLGCAYAKLFDFAEAVECFARGYTLNHRMETLKDAVDSACLSGDPSLLDRLAARFAANSSQIMSERMHMEQMMGQPKLPVQREQLIQWLEEYKSQRAG
jgi:tetratricopeptide (TPR) repeat protein